MHLASMVDMIESAYDERVLLGDADGAITGAELASLARRGAATLTGRAEALVYAGENHPLLPVALFSAAFAGIPYVPVNYRLPDDRLAALVARSPGAFVLADESTAPRLAALGALVFDDWLTDLANDPAEPEPCDDVLDPDDVAVVLYTSGTTSEPKAALLRHRHLMGYLFGAVEFASAGDDEAMLVAVPPYHIAGVANTLSNAFAGRRLVYLRAFEPNRWLELIAAERITHAMVVPTMLARIVDALDERPADVATLRTLSYGGAKVSERVVRAALRSFPDTGFVNAYGLTETASTVAVLGPLDHRAAIESDDPVVQRRLSSAGQVLPMVEIEIRDDAGRPLSAGEIGIVHLRGEQISGEYATASVLDDDGWFCTRDRGSVDGDGYLYIEGRADDTIIRGGENIAPAEIEAVLLTMPAVADACVVGVPDDEWGQQIAAAIVVRDGHELSVDDVQSTVRAALRGSKTPETVAFVDELPHTETGKLLRRVVATELGG